MTWGYTLMGIASVLLTLCVIGYVVLIINRVGRLFKLTFDGLATIDEHPLFIKYVLQTILYTPFLADLILNIGFGIALPSGVSERIFISLGFQLLALV